MLFNHTKDIIILCDPASLEKYILKSLDLAKQIVCEREGIRVINHHDALTEKARLGATRLSLFKYLDKFEENFSLDETWLKTMFKLAHEDPKISRNKFSAYLPEHTKYIKITQNDARGLRSDLRLFFHCCWAYKLVLLPLGFNDLPKIKVGPNGSPKEYAKSAYPEILKIIRAPFYEEINCDVDIYQYMPKSAMKNFGWYAYRYVRSCAAWDVEDITNDMLKELSEKPVKGFPRTVDWYLALHACLPERVNFDKKNVFSRSNVGVQGLKGTLTTENFSSLELKDNPSIINNELGSQTGRTVLNARVIIAPHNGSSLGGATKYQGLAG